MASSPAPVRQGHPDLPLPGNGRLGLHGLAQARLGCRRQLGGPSAPDGPDRPPWLHTPQRDCGGLQGDSHGRAMRTLYLETPLPPVDDWLS